MQDSTPEIRPDYRDKVVGTAKYVTDLTVPGMVHARLLRSPHPHARIASIDASQAESLPGVLGVFSGRYLTPDFCAQTHWGLYFKDRPIIAKDVVRYAGEPVAAVIAETEAIAEDALELIDVEYEPLPFVTDGRSAMQKDAPLVHDRFDVLNDFYFRGGPKPVGGTNICNRYEFDQGDVDAAFASAHTVLEDTYTFPGIFHYAMEPHAVIADFRKDGLELWSNGQTPTAIQRVCADLFDLPVSSIRVHTPYVGGGFGGKASVKLDPLAAALSKYVGKPVKLQLGLMESMQTCRRVDTAITIKTAVDENGKLTARSIDVVANCGAYADTGPAIAIKAAIRAIGPYSFPNLRLRANAVYTNTVPAASFRSIGGPQGVWASESQIDDLAHAIGMDPVEFRRKNIAPRHGVIKADLRPIDVDVLEELNRAVDLMHEKCGQETPDRPRGVAVAATDPGILPIAGAIVRLSADGHITVSASTAELGQGARGAQRFIVARCLNQPIEKVEVLEPDTNHTPYDWGTGASRSTVIVGLAIEEACQQIRKQICEAVSSCMSVSEEQVELVPGGVKTNGEFLTFKEVLRRYQGITAGEFAALGRITPHSRQGSLAQAPVFWETAAGVCEIEVDEQTGQVNVHNVSLCADVGKVINPKAAKGQDEGAMIQGLGHTLTEQYVYEDGQIVNGSAFDYKVPTIDQTPSMHAALIENGDGPGPFGSRGMGEGAILPIAPAVANAIRRKYGVRIRTLPLTPEKVWRAINEPKEGASEV